MISNEVLLWCVWLYKVEKTGRPPHTHTQKTTKPNHHQNTTLQLHIQNCLLYTANISLWYPYIKTNAITLPKMKKYIYSSGHRHVRNFVGKHKEAVDYNHHLIGCQSLCACIFKCFAQLLLPPATNSKHMSELISSKWKTFRCRRVMEDKIWGAACGSNKSCFAVRSSKPRSDHREVRFPKPLSHLR